MHIQESKDWAETLNGRGVDDLLLEYASTNDSARKSRLHRFFCLCASHAEPITSEAEVLYLPTDSDLLDSGRVECLEPGRQVAFELLGSTVPEPNINIINLQESCVFGDQTVAFDGRYLTDQVRHMSGNWLQSGEGYELPFVTGINPLTRNVHVKYPDGRVSLPDDCAYFLFHTVVGSVSYGHFILDAMLQLIAFDRLRLNSSSAIRPILISSIATSFRWPGMRWLFESLICPVDQTVVVRKNVCIDVHRAVTTNRLAHLGAEGVSVIAFSYLRKRIFENIKPSRQIDAKRVYVTRKDAGYREASNISEVESILRKHNFLFVTVQELTPQETFDIFYRAEIIVGMHGSGLMYNIFSRSKATLIELAFPGFEWQIILACAAACGHKPVRIPYVGDSVDIEELTKELSLAL